ncbi:MAG: acyltransferase family protein [Janthinobacterium lividum]
MATMLTLQEQSQLSNHRSNGFDYLRFILAVVIVGWHSLWICYGKTFDYDAIKSFEPLVLIPVPGFFAMSGFLIAGSLIRINHLPTFLTLRAIRIFPALICEVSVSALIIGAALSTLPLREYYADPAFHRYFLNLVGKMQYTLPGVFENNLDNNVNAPLWTIPYELKCYAAISILYLLTLHRRPRILLCALAIGTIAVTVYNIAYPLAPLPGRPNGQLSFAAFFWGMIAYMYREKIVHDGRVALGVFVFAWIMLSLPYMQFFAAPALAYLTVYIGLCNFRKTIERVGGEMSYGIYLYGFVIQQSVYQLLPSFRSWHAHFLISIAIACLLGYLSSILVETKALGKNNVCVRMVRALTDRLPFGRQTRKRSSSSV